MTSPQGNPARREPLLWLQLLGAAALPLEVAALLLVLSGADPGPLPGLDRLFCWVMGALGPAVLLWRLQPDLWSLLLLQVPLRGRRSDQLRLSALQDALPLKLLGAAGAVLLLPLLWWCDEHAGLAWAWSPLGNSPRLVVLLVAAALLALMLWQWQQIMQSLWMLSRPASLVQQTLPLSSSEAAERRLNLGLPLLLLDPILVKVAAQPQPAEAVVPPAVVPPTAAPPAEDPAPQEQQEVAENPEQDGDSGVEEASEAEEASAVEATSEVEVMSAVEAAPEADASADAALIVGDIAIPPEEAAEQDERNDLDQQI